MLIQQISKGGTVTSEQALLALAIADFASNFPLSPFAQFYPITGNADAPRKVDDAMSAGQNRAIGADYANPKENTPGFGAVVLKIYGDIVRTDIALVRRGGDIGDQRAIDLGNFSKSLGRYLMDAFINDAIGATKFSGLLEQCTTLSRKTVFDGTNGGALPTGNASADKKQQDKFIEQMKAMMNDIAGGPDAIIMNGAFMARLESVGRSFVTTGSAPDIYGTQHAVKQFDGVPIINAGYKANNTGLVIPNDEHEGTSEDCTSIYMVKFGEKQDLTFATNVGLDVKNLGQVGSFFETQVELDVDLVCLNSKAISRLSGIRLSA
jgi:hypothetical protein